MDLTLQAHHHDDGWQEFV